MMKPVEKHYSIEAGDPLEFIVTTKGGLTGSTVRATIKRYATQADSAAIAQVDSTPAGGIVKLNDKRARVSFESAHTRPCGDGLFFYDVLACPNGREAYSIQKGTVRTSQRITRATSKTIGVSGSSFGGGRASANVGGIAGVVAYAGLDATLTYGVATAMAASASGGTAPYAYAWSVISAPNGAVVALSDATSPTTTVALTGPNGAFTLRLTVTDAALQTAYDDVTLTLDADLPEILGSLYLLDWDANNAADGPVASLASVGSDTTPLANATSGQRPVRAATSFNGLPGITFNGVNQNLLASLATPIPSGRRPYFFLVARLTSLPSTDGYLFTCNTPTTATNRLAIYYQHGLQVRRFERITIAGGADGGAAGVEAGPFDTNPHVYGIGFTSDACSMVVDMCERAGSKTGALDDTIGRIRLGNNTEGGPFPLPMVAAQCVVCGDLPDAQQRAAVDAFLRNRWSLPALPFRTEAFDLSAVDSDFATGNFGGGETAGDYVYLLPWGNGTHNKYARWDSRLPLKSAGSWIKRDLTPYGAGPTGFCSGCTDDQHVFLSPFDRKFMRIDSLGDPDSAGSYKAKDLTEIPGTVGGTSGGCAYDGSQYVFIAPAFYGDLRGHIIVRHDALAADFTANAAYDVFDTNALHPSARGYLGVGISATHVYFSPYANNGVTHGHFIRYRRSGLFSDLGSWEYFDLTTKHASLKGINGIVCVGTKVYLVPGEETYNAGDGHIGACFDEAGDFDDPASYTTFDFHSVNASAQGFMFAKYDGSRYIDYPQEHSSTVVAAVRFDTQGSYTDPASYRVIEPASVQAYVGMATRGAVSVLAPNTGKWALKISP